MAAITTTNLFPPPIRGMLIDAAGMIGQALQKWLFSIQMAHPLKIVDTSGGPVAETLPPAGLNATTGQSNQNQEIIYVKSSADANAATITGALGGPYSITAQFQSIRFKSDGTNWWKSGCCPGIAAPPPA